MGAETRNDAGSRRVDSQQLARQWAILRLLSESGRAFGVKELADQLGVSKPTIQRDLATLENEFALIEEQVGAQKKVYRIDRSIQALEKIDFGTTELLAVHAALASAGSLAGSPLHADLQQVMQKVRGFLAPRHNGGLDAMARVFVPHVRGFVDYAPHADTIDCLADCIGRRYLCRVVYHAAWKGTTREHLVRPLRLVWHRSALYLLCQRESHAEITTLAVHRIRECERTSEGFRPPRVDVDAHVHKAFGIFVSDDEQDVEILFDEAIAWRVEERTFHPDESKERLADGRLRYRVRSSAQWEIVPWVLSYGDQAELVEPQSWRDEIARTLAEQARRYGEPR